ncbi:hypothetical protein [Mycobacterium sp. 852002-51971_SCH5477799-a]
MLQAERADGGPAVLVRPDGYIAWAGPSAQAADAVANITGRGVALRAR